MSVSSDPVKLKIENSSDEEQRNGNGINHSESPGESYSSNSDHRNNDSGCKSRFSRDGSNQDSSNAKNNHDGNDTNSTLETAIESSTLDSKIQNHESTEPSSKDTNQDSTSAHESTKEIDSSLSNCAPSSQVDSQVESEDIIVEKKEPTPEEKEQEGIQKCEKDISQILPNPATLFLGARPHPPGARLEQWLIDHGIGAILDLTTFYSPHKRIKGVRGGELVYSPRSNPWSSKIDYKNIPVFDLSTVDLYAVFKEAHDFIHENRVRAQRQAEGKEVEKSFSFTRKKKEHPKGGVLVHCEAGMSRSPTIVISYLVRYHNMSLSQAFVYVRARRGIAPNYGFALQLIRFANECRAREKKAKSRSLRRLKREAQPAFEEPDHADFLIQIFLHRYPDVSKTRDEIKNALNKNGSFENAYAELTTDENKNSDTDGKIQIVVEIKETTSTALRSPNAYPIASTSRDTSSLPSSTGSESSIKKTKKSKSRKHIGIKAATWSWVPSYTSKGSYW